MDRSALGHWWTTLGDSRLTDLIDRALAGNLDLKQAASRMAEAWAERGVAAGREYPTVAASGSTTRSQISRNALGNLESIPAVGKTLADRLAQPSTGFAAGFNASWEMDLFGRLRRQTEAAEANLQASVEDLRAIRVGLLGEVGLAYTEFRACQSSLALTRSALATQTRMVDLLKANVDQGEASLLDLEQARTRLEASRADLPGLNASLARSEHRLEALLGLWPRALEAELAAQEPIPAAPPSVALGIPADVLRQRPDVRRAEQQYLAQTARVGVAMADRYPRLSWGGTIGLESIDSGNLLSRGSRVFGIGPSVAWNVFDAGRLRSNVQVMNARQDQALVAFEAAVLRALHEVEAVLTDYGNDQIRRQDQLEAERAAQRVLDISQALFTGGETDDLGVLAAQQALLDRQLQRLQSEAAVTMDLVRLYQALGGGWDAPDPIQPPSAPRLARGQEGP